MALHSPLSPLTHNRDTVTASHGRPNPRSRLHSCHDQEGGARIHKKDMCWRCGKNISKILVLFLPDIKFEQSRALSAIPPLCGGIPWKYAHRN